MSSISKFELRQELARLGLEKSIDSLPDDIADVAIATPCYQAFFKAVSDINDLRHLWSKIQDRIADLKARTPNLARDTYLTFLVSGPYTPNQLREIQEVTTDPLVCRKIVLLSNGQGWRESLKELPFLGIRTGVTVKSVLGVKHVLSTLERRGYSRKVVDILGDWASAERMLTRLLELPIPRSVPPVLEPTFEAGLLETNPSDCRLIHLRVHNFRALRKLDVNLSNNITVVYGQNGTGKTAVFDAIEWVLTGRVERLDAAAENGSDQSPLRNLFSGDQPCSAELVLMMGSKRVIVSRTLDLQNNAHAVLDGHPIDDVSLLKYVVGEQSARIDARTIKRLLKSNSFFAQSTLARFLSDSPEERYWAITHLLGTQDYTRLTDKLDEMNNELERRVASQGLLENELDSTFHQLSEQIDARTKILAESSTIADLSKQLGMAREGLAGALQKIASPYARLLVRDYGNYEELKSSLSIASEWVRNEERTLRLNYDRYMRAALSLRATPDFERAAARIRGEIGSLEHQASEQRELLNSTLKENESVKVAYSGIEQQVTRLSVERAQLERAMSVLQEYESIKTLHDKQIEELSSIVGTINGLRTELEKVSLDTHEKETLLHASNLRLTQLRMTLTTVEKAMSFSHSWSTLAQERSVLQEQLKSLNEQIKEQQQQRNSLVSQYATLSAELTNIERSIEIETKTLSRFKELLVEIQSFIEGHECPLCGHDWNTDDELRSSLAQKGNVVPVELARLTSLRQDLSNRLDNTRAAQAYTDQQYTRLSDEQEQLTDRFRELQIVESTYVDAVEKLGIVADPDRPPVDLLNEIERNTRQQLTMLNSEIVTLQSRVSELRATTALLDRRMSELTKRNDDLEESRFKTRKQLDQLGESLAFLNRDPESLTLDWLRAQMRDLTGQIEATSIQRDEASKRALALESRLDQLGIELQSIQRRMIDAQQSLSAQETSINRARAVVGETGFPNADEKMLREKAEATQQILATMADIRRRIESLEQIRSWLIAQQELEELNGRIGQTNASRENVKSELRKLRSWKEHLSQLSTVIMQCKEDAEKAQFEFYEPTINLLLQRLYHHPLFGGVKIDIDSKRRSARIDVKINPALESNAGGSSPHVVPPILYFSEGQLNMLALSLFLSHSVQQRWTSFVPLLLDDPIQNMDNLNVNSMIDCLRGLAEANRQFVIATCDVEFYRLLLLKLRCLRKSNSQSFSAYRLEGISSMGPELIRDFPVDPPAAGLVNAPL